MTAVPLVSPVDAAAPAIALWVSDGNDAARRVYERCGFTATGERDIVRGGLWEKRMRRALITRIR